MVTYETELVGGHPALDFLNTVNDWTATEPEDRLVTFEDAVAFAAKAGVVERDEVARLRSDGGAGELDELRMLRSRLQHVFQAVIDERAPGRNDLEALGSELARAARALRLRANDGGFALEVDVGAARAATLRWRLVHAAVALLTSAELGRLKACPRCGWFFLDASKNRSRRWCSMATCGSTEKSRAYYHRRRRHQRTRSDGERA